jgi:hypothetical protein
MACPIPRLAPVTTTTLSVKRFVSIFRFALSGRDALLRVRKCGCAAAQPYHARFLP